MNFSNKKSEIPLYIGLYLLGLLVQYIYFGTYVTAPNSHMVAHGGDALVIYYDMMCYICHDGGLQLEFMNYPYGESIFMTDMQASFSIVLKWLHQFVDICDYIPGFVHGIIMFLMPITGLFLYKILRMYSVEVWMSFCFALVITYLSPQIFRFVGHFGLVYPLLVPMSLYWYTDLYQRSTWAIRDIVIGFFLFFFMLNNAYTGLIATAPLIAAGFLLLLTKDWNRGTRILLGGLIPLVLGYIVINITDPFDDRLKVQWGAFHYNVDLEGLFYPSGSLFFDFVSKYQDLKHLPIDKQCNLGLSNIVMWTFLGLGVILSVVKGKKWYHFDKRLAVMAGSGILAALYAIGSNLAPWIKEILETHLSELMMFKSGGRLAWVTYYVMSLTGVVLLSRLVKLYSGNRYLIALPIAILLLWGTEVNHYLHKRFKNIFHDNHFKKENVNADAAKLSPETYQAFYTIPPLQSWNDKIRFDYTWKSQYTSLMLSAKTGIPLINSQLSRAPVNSMASSIAISSHPVLPKPRLKELGSEKPILLVVDRDDKRTMGEQYLLDNSEFLGEYLKCDLYAMPATLEAAIPTLPDSSAHYMHISYDDKDSEAAMIGTAGNHVEVGSENLFYQDSLDFTPNQWLIVSYWHYVDTETYIRPHTYIMHAGKKYEFDWATSRDYLGNWRVQATGLHYKGGPVTIGSESEVPYMMDELHIQGVHDTTYFTSESGTMFFNGYPVVGGEEN